MSRSATSTMETRIERKDVAVKISHVHRGDKNRVERHRCRDWPRPPQRRESSGTTLMSRSATSATETRIEWNDIDVKISHVRWGDENRTERHQCRDWPRLPGRRELNRTTSMSRLATSTGERRIERNATSTLMRIKQNNVDVEISHVRPCPEKGMSFKYIYLWSVYVLKSPFYAEVLF